MVFQFPAPIIMALILNEFRMKRYKKVLQTIYTFPHFLSWVIVASIATNVLSLDGLVNQVILLFGGEPVNFLGDADIFIPVMYATDIWKYAGYGAIIYLASISGIDMEQYEAADIDGASRMQKLFRITIPNIMPTIIVMFIMTMGGLMSQGFEQVFNMRNAAVQEAVEVLDMYIYRITFPISGRFFVFYGGKPVPLDCQHADADSGRSRIQAYGRKWIAWIKEGIVCKTQCRPGGKRSEKEKKSM